MVKIFPETVKDPISLIGRCAGVCWGSDTSDPVKNYKRGLNCIKSNHGRALEYPDIYAVLDGYSARVIREWYTHIGGSPTRLQESTRYVDCEDVSVFMPYTVANNETVRDAFESAISESKKAYADMIASGVPKEDAANVLPLGMKTKVVDKRNLRNVIDMSRQRMCSRAYHEYRAMFTDYLGALCEYSPEWEEVVLLAMKPKCAVTGYCTEKESCGRRRKKENGEYN